jgi:hypothetical protein
VFHARKKKVKSFSEVLKEKDRMEYFSAERKGHRDVSQRNILRKYILDSSDSG